MLTKTDLITEPEQLSDLKTKFEGMGLEVLSLSSVTGDGVLAVKRRLAQLVRIEKEKMEAEEAANEEVFIPSVEQYRNDAGQSANT